MSALRVMYFAGTNDKNGGSLHSLVDIAKTLKTQGAIVPFVILPGHGSGEELLKAADIEFAAVRNYGSEWPLGAPKPFRARLSHFRQRLENRRAVRIVCSLAKERQIQLIHINTSTNEIGYYVAKTLGIPFVWHVREFIDMSLGLEFYSPKRVYRHMKKAAAIITISRMLQELYARILPKQKVLLVHNGIDTTLFRDEHDGIYDRGPLTIAMIGRLSRLKGFYDIVDALALIPGIDVRVLIMGTGDEGFLEYAKQKGVASKLIMLGYQDDVRPFLRQSQVYLSAHRCEAFGRATVEAMLAGCCVIGVDNAGTKDLIVNEESGFLYPVGGIGDLARIIKTLSMDRTKIAPIAQKAISRAQEMFSLARLCRELESIYTKIVHEECTDYENA